MTTKQSIPLSNRECMKLLETWGFQREKRNGGHLVMIRDGKRVQISAPSRRMPTPYKALRQAAAISGVDLPTFLHGPSRASAATNNTVEIRVQQPCGCVVDEHGFVPCTEHQPKEEVVAVAEVAEVEIPRRKRIRKQGSTPIAEVSWKRTNRGRAAVRSFGIEESDLDIEMFEEIEDLEEVEDEIEEIEEIVSAPAPVRRSSVKVEAPTKTPRDQAEAMFAKLFPGKLVVDDAVEDARSVWIAATSALIRTMESTSK